VLQDNNGRCESTDSAIPRVPPPGYMSGKWLPGKQVRPDDGGSTQNGNVGNRMLNPPLRKSGSTIQYWCGQCNRRLSSRTLYERHLMSELHFKRTVQERELEEHPMMAQGDINCRRNEKRTVRRTEVYLNSELWVSRNRRRSDSTTVSGFSRTSHELTELTEECRLLGYHAVWLLLEPTVLTRDTRRNTPEDGIPPFECLLHNAEYRIITIS
jgi:hypothetical protein